MSKTKRVLSSSPDPKLPEEDEKTDSSIMLDGLRRSERKRPPKKSPWSPKLGRGRIESYEISSDEELDLNAKEPQTRQERKERKEAERTKELIGKMKDLAKKLSTKTGTNSLLLFHLKNGTKEEYLYGELFNGNWKKADVDEKLKSEGILQKLHESLTLPLPPPSSDSSESKEQKEATEKYKAVQEQAISIQNMDKSAGQVELQKMWNEYLVFKNVKNKEYGNKRRPTNFPQECWKSIKLLTKRQCGDAATWIANAYNTFPLGNLEDVYEVEEILEVKKFKKSKCNKISY